ncbi:MAG: radical SAM protein [Bacillota bacterium]
MEVPAYRPPSEAQSMLIRVTRNCPWNKCAFCGMYRGKKFSIRTPEEIKKEIIRLRSLYEKTKENRTSTKPLLWENSLELFHFPWLFEEDLTAFIADSDSLVMKPYQLAEIIGFLRKTFPEIKRVTCYARAKTILRRSLDELKVLKTAGLDRLHIGLETGNDELLQLINKGTTSQGMITAGLLAKEAGFSLSLYVILGLGGKLWWEQHALDTAKVLNEVNPHFIRIRTLRIIPETPLQEMREKGLFVPASKIDILKEELLLIENLRLSSEFVSDHISNLLMLNGKLPEAKDQFSAEIQDLLSRMEGLQTK